MDVESIFSLFQSVFVVAPPIEIVFTFPVRWLIVVITIEIPFMIPILVGEIVLAIIEIVDVPVGLLNVDNNFENTVKRQFHGIIRKINVVWNIIFFDDSGDDSLRQALSSPRNGLKYFDKLGSRQVISEGFSGLIKTVIIADLNGRFDFDNFIRELKHNIPPRIYTAPVERTTTYPMQAASTRNKKRKKREK